MGKNITVRSTPPPASSALGRAGRSEPSSKRRHHMAQGRGGELDEFTIAGQRFVKVGYDTVPDRTGRPNKRIAIWASNCPDCTAPFLQRHPLYPREAVVDSARRRCPACRTTKGRPIKPKRETLSNDTLPAFPTIPTQHACAANALGVSRSLPQKNGAPPTLAPKPPKAVRKAGMFTDR